MGHACYGCTLLHRGTAVCTYRAAAFDGEGISSLRYCLSAFFIRAPPPPPLPHTVPVLPKQQLLDHELQVLSVSVSWRREGAGVQDSGWKTDTSDGL